MLTAQALTQRFETETLTPGTRILALGFWLINVPALVIGLLTVLGIPIMIPGIVLFINYIRIALDRVSFRTAQGTWVGTMLYNGVGILWACYMLFQNGIPDLEIFWTIIPPFFGFAVGALGYNMLKEKEWGNK